MNQADQLELLYAYVLDELSEGERVRVEAQLETDAGLRKLLREVEEDLATFAVATAQEAVELPTPLPTAVAELKAAIRGESSSPTIQFPQEAEPKQRTAPSSFLWPIAAAILLGLNVFQWLTDASPKSSPGTEGQHFAEGDASELPDAANADGNARLEIARLAAWAEELEDQRSAAVAALQEAQENSAAWEGRATSALAANRMWEQQYSRLVNRVSPIFESDDNLTRYTVIELADPETLASGAELAGFGRYIDDFINNLGGATALAGNNADTAGTSNVEGDLLAGGDVIDEVTAARLQAASGITEPQLTGDPAAFTVWNDDDQSGFIDFYDMPTPQVGYEYRLYVRGIDSDNYQNVGVLPKDLQTGSFAYSLTGEGVTPTGVIVTEEAVGSVADQPTGRIILKGPGD